MSIADFTKETEEWWDLYDQNRIPTGNKHRRSDALAEGEYHLVVHVCIFNSKNELLCQRRQPFKYGWPNMWDITVGGSALTGEDCRMAAERELFEEIGLKMDFSNRRPRLTIHFNHGFDDYFLLEQEVDTAALTLQEEEVKEVRWFSKEEVMQMQENGTMVPYTIIDALFEMHKNCGEREKVESIEKICIESAGEKHLASWMNLMEILRDDFPGLETEKQWEDYQNTVRRMMEDGRAVCALHQNLVVGFLLFSKKSQKLCQLAVHPEFRRLGIASAMLERMLQAFDTKQEIVVETFREGDAKGIAARAFYKAKGFAEGALCTFEGYPLQEMILKI